MTRTEAPLDRRPHAPYRFYDAAGELLYVGITASLPSRLGGHRSDKPWWTEVANVRVEHFADRASVLQAEKSAIARERPRWNVAHNPRVGGCRSPRTSVSIARPAKNTERRRHRTLLYEFKEDKGQPWEPRRLGDSR